MPEFVEKYLRNNYRHRIFRIMESSNINDIPTELHTQKSESMDQPDEDRAEIN